MVRYSISQPVSQVEAPRLLTGKGRYTDDVTLPRQTHGIFLRSPHAHADIVSISADAARQMPGVLAVLTGADYEADGLGNVTGASPGKLRDGSPMFRPPRPALTNDRVRHVGQAVALIVAETIDQAKDAAEAVEVDYAPLPANLSTAEANQPGTPALRAEAPNNEAMYFEQGTSDAVDQALEAAAHVVRDRFVVNRVTANTIEPRAVAAEYDDGRDHFTIYACMQRPYIWRTLMTKHVFDIPEHQMRLIAGDVGGSFGMKGGLYIEVPLIAWASKKVGRPVKWACERSEGHMADDQGRDMVIDAELGLDAEGNFLAARYTSNNNIGAYLSMIGFLTTRGIAGSMCGPYTTPLIHGRAAAVMTNTVCVSNYRAPGGTPGTYVLERMIDMAARDMGLDRVEMRRRNLIPASAMPYRLPTNATYDCGEFEAVMDKCLEKSDYAGGEARRRQSKSNGKLRGIGISTTVDPSAGPSPETAEVRFDPGGTATVIVGSTAGGQSHETIYTQIVSQHLGLEAETIRVLEGDTDKLSWGTGTGAARTATIGGTAVFKAAQKVIEKGRRIAAHILETAEADIEFDEGVFSVAGTDRSVTITEVAQTAFDQTKLPPEIEIGLYETATWSPDTNNIPNSCHICEVEIDPETGAIEIDRYTAIHDVGVELNPNSVRSQVHGGIAQAAGQALMEDMVYDAESGQILSGSFLDYAMPRADNLCNFDIGSHPVPATTNPLGVKGAGECGTVGGLAAVMNAINDALEPLGVRNISMPATPEKVWAALQEAGAA
ncbi:MAG: xanthine dehydrogenase family protein molybdopterin-binding subunit [Rhodospirillales bacterium]|nr:xanthine dehydrogenase family protein molybdopterin-binding subunit [Rhodospirillales bacterium]